MNNKFKSTGPWDTNTMVSVLKMSLSKNSNLISSVLSVSLLGIFLGITCYGFIQIHHVQPTPYLDEIFHVPQAINYCIGEFSKWDPKITTLPGLYLISISMLMPLNALLFKDPSTALCNIYYLRLTNLVACVVNFYLLYIIRRKLSRQGIILEKESELKSFLLALTLWLFPILYFFTFLYYTDTVSTTSILLMYNLHLGRRYNLAAFVGLISVLIRQTNIVWVLFLALNTLPEIIVRNSQIHLKGKHFRSLEKRPMYFKVLFQSLLKIWNTNVQGIIGLFIDCLHTSGCYIVVGVCFVIFLLLNKGIVVGDKSAHQPVFHLMQLPYFSLLLMAFCIPIFVFKIPVFFRCLSKYKKALVCSFIGLLALVHFNTMAHPYLLADNRHYVFYIWNRIFQRHYLYRFLLVPCYMLAIFTSAHLLQHTKIVFRSTFLLCLILCLVPQKLLEFRYFILPYLIFHLHVNVSHLWHLFVEIFLYTSLNAITIYIFMTKTFYWADSPEAQRFIW